MWVYILDKDFRFKKKVLKTEYCINKKRKNERAWKRNQQPKGDLVFKIEVNGEEIFSMKTVYRSDHKLRRLY